MDRNPSLRRVIVDFKKLTPEVLKLTIEKFPDGYASKAWKNLIDN